MQRLKDPKKNLEVKAKRRPWSLKRKTKVMKSLKEESEAQYNTMGIASDPAIANLEAEADGWASRVIQNPVFELDPFLVYTFQKCWMDHKKEGKRFWSKRPTF